MKQRQQARDEVLTTHQLVEEERRKAEEKLQRRMERLKDKQNKERPSGGSLQTDDGGTEPGNALSCMFTTCYH